MALTVETGLGVAGADSFASVAEADNFWGGRPEAGAAWLALPVSRKEEYLRSATDYVAARLSANAPLASLAWPWADYTATAADRSRVARATILAADVARLGPLVGGAAAGGRITSQSKSLGPLSKSTTFSDREAPASANGRDLSFVDNLLGTISGMSGGGGFVIGRRARS